MDFSIYPYKVTIIMMIITPITIERSVKQDGNAAKVSVFNCNY